MNKSHNKGIFVLLFRCKDQKGIVAKIADLIYTCGANIISSDQHTTDPEGGHFFMRIEFMFDCEGYDKVSLISKVTKVAEEFNATWQIHEKSDILRMGILVSRPDHCLHEILYLWSIGELRVEIPFIISNYEKHDKLAAQYGIPFHFINADKNNRKESDILSFAADKTDFLVLARYMLVFSNDFLRSYAKDIINIHHGLLPSFKGANPYERAFDEGVKVIGATAHFVNERLDEGPIISQETEGVSHKDSPVELMKKGRDLEKKALSDAIAHYLDFKIIRHANKTIIF